MSLTNALRSPSRFGGVSPVEMAMTLIVQRGISIGPVGPQELQYRNKLQAVVVGIKRRSLGLRTPNVHGAWLDSVVRTTMPKIHPTLESAAAHAKSNAVAADPQPSNKPLVAVN
jgi:hypothetical protein